MGFPGCRSECKEENCTESSSCQNGPHGPCSLCYDGFQALLTKKLLFAVLLVFCVCCFLFSLRTSCIFGGYIAERRSVCDGAMSMREVIKKCTFPFQRMPNRAAMAITKAP